MKKHLAFGLFFLCLGTAALAVQVAPGYATAGQIVVSPDIPGPSCLPDDCLAQ